MKYLQLFDFLNVKPGLFLNKKEHYSSKLGIYIGLLTFITCFGFVIFFIDQYVKKDDRNVVFNEIVDFNHELKLTDIPFIFKLTNSKGKSYFQNITTFNFQHWIFPHESNGVPIVNDIPYEKCNVSKHLINSKYKNYFIGIDFESYYCLNLEDYDLTINGTFGDMKKGYSYINLYLNECRNSSPSIYNNTIINFNETQCADKSEILKEIGDLTLYLRIAYIDFQIDHADYNNPSKPYLKSDAILFTYKSKSRVFYYFKDVFYYTDIGYFEKNNIMQPFFTFDNYHITYPQVKFLIKEAFGVFSILISDKGCEYKKSFPKIQTLIANIGGIIKGLTLIMELILHYFSKKSLLIYYANFLIDNNDLKNEKNNKIEKIENNQRRFYKNYFNYQNQEIRNFYNSNMNFDFSNENLNDLNNKNLFKNNFKNEVDKEICKEIENEQNSFTKPINLISINKSDNKLINYNENSKNKNINIIKEIQYNNIRNNSEVKKRNNSSNFIVRQKDLPK